MKRFLAGLVIGVVVAITTIGLKAALTKYPGIGDFMLFSFVVERVPALLRDSIYEFGLDLRVISYLAKAAVAVVLYAALFVILKNHSRLQQPISVGVCTRALVYVSWGSCSRMMKRPNKAPEPTPGSVTPRARGSACDFEWRDGARVAPAPVVAHL